MSISRSTFAYQIRTCDISICLAPRKIYTSPNCVRIASNECQVERARDADVTRVQLMCCCIACKTVHSRVETSHTLHQTVAFIICKPRSRPTDPHSILTAQRTEIDRQTQSVENGNDSQLEISDAQGMHVSVGYRSPLHMSRFRTSNTCRGVNWQ